MSTIETRIVESTETITITEPEEQQAAVVSMQLQPTESRNVRFTEETVDNEGMGKKSSKKCCIYHKPKKFGESSSSETDSSDDENSYEKMKKTTKHKHKHSGAGHSHSKE